MNKISACLVLRNEGKNVKRCLESLRGAVDEIIIAHDGECSDDTLDICKEYTDRIFIRPFVGYMDAHLPFVFSRASGDWILRIDGDEFLSDELNKNLRVIVSSGVAEAYSLIWPLWDGKKVVASTGSRKLALFMKERVVLVGMIHFKPEIMGRIEMADFVLNHQPDYDNLSIKIFIKKWIPWAYLDAATYFKKMADIETFNYNKSYLPLNLLVRKYFAPILFLVTLPVFILKGLRNSLKNRNAYYLKLDIQFGIYRTLLEFFIMHILAKRFFGVIRDLIVGGNRHA